MPTKTVKIGRRGNGLRIRIPAAIVRGLNLQVGEEMELVAVRDHSFELRRAPTPPSAAKRAHASDPAL
jgi:antitoxin component of MazEF toxin-antitoxin module